MKLLLFLLLLIGCNAWYYGRPPPGASTTGGVWPLPLNQTTTKIVLGINPPQFQFQYDNTCDILKQAVKRYTKLSFTGYDAKTFQSLSSNLLKSLTIKSTSGCTTAYPQLEMDESYSLSIGSNGLATLSANQVWGVLRGLETFSQLIYSPKKNSFSIMSNTIYDKPRFPHRGVMIDSSRHFLPVGVLLQNLDIMAMNKLNVFHWHLVDSESFPYPSLKYPNLTLLGAYTPAHTYTIADIKKVIEYARLRGIRVVPEFDTPGHTGSWGHAFPKLLSTCYNSHGAVNQLSNIIDASYEPNYDILYNIFEEALALFKDNHFHFGGDEVYYDMINCWQNNPEVRQRMQKMGFQTNNQLLNYYWNRIFKIVDSARPGTKKIVWQEVLDQNVPAKESIAHVWKGDTYAEALDEMAAVTKAGHYAILSSCWYLNYIKYGADWGYVNNDAMRERGLYYECDPTDFIGTDKQKSLVLGGEIALWGEFVDSTNLIQRLWPRGSAVAERLWSDSDATSSADEAWPRLHEFRCRMLRRGFPGQPINNPDYCPEEWNPPYEEL